ncbi:hypothetical protein BC940DRAFT_346168 [Gongronella butleri]|nr:hypothetical protein BC940DRAFT_346168 [Gongronella butleri]
MAVSDDSKDQLGSMCDAWCTAHLSAKDDTSAHFNHDTSSIGIIATESSNASCSIDKAEDDDSAKGKRACPASVEDARRRHTMACPRLNDPVMFLMLTSNGSGEHTRRRSALSSLQMSRRPPPISPALWCLLSDLPFDPELIERYFSEENDAFTLNRPKKHFKMRQSQSAIDLRAMQHHDLGHGASDTSTITNGSTLVSTSSNSSFYSTMLVDEAPLHDWEDNSSLLDEFPEPPSTTQSRILLAMLDANNTTAILCPMDNERPGKQGQDDVPDYYTAHLNESDTASSIYPFYSVPSAAISMGNTENAHRSTLSIVTSTYHRAKASLMQEATRWKLVVTASTSTSSASSTPSTLNSSDAVSSTSDAPMPSSPSSRTPPIRKLARQWNVAVKPNVTASLRKKKTSRVDTTTHASMTPDTLGHHHHHHYFDQPIKPKNLHGVSRAGMVATTVNSTLSSRISSSTSSTAPNASPRPRTCLASGRRTRRRSQFLVEIPSLCLDGLDDLVDVDGDVKQGFLDTPRTYDKPKQLVRDISRRWQTIRRKRSRSQLSKGIGAFQYPHLPFSTSLEHTPQSPQPNRASLVYMDHNMFSDLMELLQHYQPLRPAPPIPFLAYRLTKDLPARPMPQVALTLHGENHDDDDDNTMTRLPPPPRRLTLPSSPWLHFTNDNAMLRPCITTVIEQPESDDPLYHIDAIGQGCEDEKNAELVENEEEYPSTSPSSSSSSSSSRHSVSSSSKSCLSNVSAMAQPSRPAKSPNCQSAAGKQFENKPIVVRDSSYSLL